MAELFESFFGTLEDPRCAAHFSDVADLDLGVGSSAVLAKGEARVGCHRADPGSPDRA
jgi:hypothetical protein